MCTEGVQQRKNRALVIGLLFTVISLFATAHGQKDDGEFECPSAVGNGNYADPKTCRRFYQCVDGYPYINRCPSGLYFDDISKFCTFKAEARCGPIAATAAPVTDAPQDLALKCDTSKCELPYCFCSKDATVVPGGLDPEDIPQIVMLTFDGAVNLNNYDHYKKVFNGKRKNPNGCAIKGTFFISHEYSNYQQIQTLAFEGHEIATETISLQTGLQDKGYEDEVVGMRAPFLKPGRNTQYKVIEDFGYIYDSSVTVPPVNVPVWPYTLDYKISHECKSGTCPTRRFPGVWEVPLNAHYIEGYEGGHCPYLDQCVLHNLDSEEVLEWLQEDFARHYEQNKAPYMMPFHTNWFQIKELEQGLHKFLDWMLTLPDVYVVTVTQALGWMTDPHETRNVNNLDAWDCKKQVPSTSKPCSNSISCALAFKVPEANITDTRYMETCAECPNQYPWLGDAEGTGISGRDNYIYSGSPSGQQQQDPPESEE
ncbi:unnamed protein product [Hermetia illucens]|uniref:Chitin-binding type-2 domain-containing protein n=1 Tax=Hermetia illucens TaxID=343691 RepID=A0A7R8UZK9_HERIL|nr:unnamed protein product [Hermetia illucens]